MAARSVLQVPGAAGSFPQQNRAERTGWDKRNVLGEPLVITGVGLITSLGSDSQSVWSAVRQESSGVRPLMGIDGLPDGMLLAATVDLEGTPTRSLKVLHLCDIAASEVLHDAGLAGDQVDRSNMGCWISACMPDDRGTLDPDAATLDDRDSDIKWYDQFMPHVAHSHVMQKYGLFGPNMSHSTACGSGLIEMLSATRALRDGQCDAALVGSGEAVSRMLAAGFHRMGVLAYDEAPEQACRPLDSQRRGFVLGEGAAMFVVERLGHALKRGAKIYAQIDSCRCLSEAHHITGLDEKASTLTRLIQDTLGETGLEPRDIGYVSAYGTATEQNDKVEMRGIHNVLGSDTSSYCVIATKSMHGHLLNAAGCVELAITTLAMRDGFSPPTINLTNPDPKCHFDGVPLVGRENRFQHALKLSLAFGGHLVSVCLSRWNDAQTGFAYPSVKALPGAQAA